MANLRHDNGRPYIAHMKEPLDIAFVPNREVRRVPKGWRHPLDERGSPIPLLPEGAWEHDSGIPREECMPDAYGETNIMAYETVSEGTPISPPFPNTPEGRVGLLEHCAKHATTFGDHTADVEAWAAILFGAASVGGDGTVRGS